MNDLSNERAIPPPFPYPYAAGFAVSADGLIFMWNGSSWQNIGGGDPTAGEPIIVPGTVAQYWRGDKTWQTLNKAAVGLANVDNTSDVNKPISTATQAALNGKEPNINTGSPTQFWAGDKTWKTVPPTGEPVINPGTVSQYWRGDKTWQILDKQAIGLNNVDNTSDVNKPISTATATALAGKEATIAAGTTAQFWRGDKTWQPIPATDWGTITNKPVTFPPTLPIASSGITGLDTAQAAQDTRLTNIETKNTSQDTAIAGKEPTIAAGTTAQYWRGDKSWQTHDKASVGLGNVDNTSDANKPVSTATATQLALKEDKANKGIANGYASLDASAKVPAAQLPAYVDDVVEYANLAAFPATGSTGIIYVALDTNRVYRWSGSAYVEISPSPGSTDAVPEGTTNKYYLASRALADVTWGTITGKPGTFPPSAHSHPESEVTNLVSDLALKATLASPVFTGDPQAPTPATADNDTSIATTAFVKAQGYVTSSGVTSVTGTAPVVSSGGAAPAISMPAATGSVPGHLTAADWTTFNGKQPLIVGGTTAQYWRGDKAWATLDKAAVGLGNVDNTSDANKPVSTATQTALNAKLDTATAATTYAPIASPALTGNPTAPTPSPGDNDTSLATTAFVTAAITADITPWSEITGKPTTFPPTLPITEADVTNLIADLALKAGLASPIFTGNPTAPTPSPGDNDTSLATTAFVAAAMSAAVAGVSSFNTRTGAVVLSSADVTNALTFTPANIASPTFTGDPKAPTPLTADNDTSIATTAFVKAQAYAPLAAPVFTGDARAVTPATADNDTSIATTAFVKAQAYLSSIPADYWNSTNCSIVSASGTSFYAKFANGFTMQFGYVSGTSDSYAVFPLTFTGLYAIMGTATTGGQLAGNNSCVMTMGESDNGKVACRLRIIGPGTVSTWAGFGWWLALGFI